MEDIQYKDKYYKYKLKYLDLLKDIEGGTLSRGAARHQKEIKKKREKEEAKKKKDEEKKKKAEEKKNKANNSSLLRIDHSLSKPFNLNRIITRGYKLAV